MAQLANCTKDQLTIHNGNDIEAPLIASLCKRNNVVLLSLYSYYISVYETLYNMAPTICIMSEADRHGY